MSAAILPDLPLEEVGPWARQADAAGVETVLLGAPTGSDDRLAAVKAQYQQSVATYLNQVYAAGRAGLVQLDGQNVFVYRGGLTSNSEDADVEFGVGVSAPFAPSGAVVYSTLPTGEVATATDNFFAP